MDADSRSTNSTEITDKNDKNDKPKPHKVRRFFLGWLVALNNGVTKFLKKALGNDYRDFTEDEVLDMVDAMVKTTNDDGDDSVIEETSAQMINNIFEFNDLNASDVMVHRTNIVGVDKNTSLDDIIYMALDKGFSRFPVFDGSVDKILGIIIVKDLLCLVGKDDISSFKVEEFLREVVFIPEACPCLDAFRSMTSLKSGMAVVVDEYGGTAGIVTLENIIEAVMGNIQDEYDDEETEIVKIGDEQYDINGEADPEEVMALFGAELPEEHEYQTIAGFITDKLGYIPEGDEITPPSVDYEGIKLIVLEVEDRCISKVRASKSVKTQQKNED